MTTPTKPIMDEEDAAGARLERLLRKVESTAQLLEKESLIARGKAYEYDRGRAVALEQAARQLREAIKEKV